MTSDTIDIEKENQRKHDHDMLRTSLRYALLGLVVCIAGISTCNWESMETRSKREIDFQKRTILQAELQACRQILESKQ